MNVKDMAYYRNFSYNLMQSRKMNQKNKSSKSSNAGQKKIHVHIGFNSAGTMAKLANAKTRTQVEAIQRSLSATLKFAKTVDTDEKTLTALKKAINKAGIKAKALGKEEQMENMKKAANAAKNFKRQLKIQQELNHKRNARKRKERTDILDQESIFDNEDRYSHYSSGDSFDFMCDRFETSVSMEVEEGSNVDLGL